MAPLLSATRRRDLLLDHRARSRTSTRRQRFSFDSGRVSWTRTRSPTLSVVGLVVDVELLGALHRLVVAAGGGTRSVTATTAVLSIPSEVTMPSRTLRALGRVGVGRRRPSGVLPLGLERLGGRDLAGPELGVDAGDVLADAARARLTLSSWPVACWKRRLNSSSLASASRSHEARRRRGRGACWSFGHQKRLLPGRRSGP